MNTGLPVCAPRESSNTGTKAVCVWAEPGILALAHCFSRIVRSQVIPPGGEKPCATTLTRKPVSVIIEANASTAGMLSSCRPSAIDAALLGWFRAFSELPCSTSCWWRWRSSPPRSAVPVMSHQSGLRFFAGSMKMRKDVWLMQVSRSSRCGRRFRSRASCCRGTPAFPPWKAPLQLRRVWIRQHFSAGQDRIGSF
jgi:hypothetical protein